MSILAAPLESELLGELDRRHMRVWRPSEHRVAALSATQQWEVAHRLARAGALERLERGAYLVVPRSGARLIPPLELVGAWFSHETYAVVGAAAAEHHGLTYDTPSKIEVQLSRAKREEVSFQGKLYRFVRSRPESVTSDNSSAEVGEQRTIVAAPPKLLVLLLNQHRRGPGTDRDSRLALEVIERGAARNVWRSVRWDRVARVHGTAATARRLGYLLERYSQPGWEKLLPLRGRAGYTRFSALHPAEGEVDPKWRLLLNDPILKAIDANSHA
jgi:predicted transcriptional regulator of viral defense system